MNFVFRPASKNYHCSKMFGVLVSACVAEPINPISSTNSWKLLFYVRGMARKSHWALKLCFLQRMSKVGNVTVCTQEQMIGCMCWNVSESTLYHILERLENCSNQNYNIRTYISEQLFYAFRHFLCFSTTPPLCKNKFKVSILHKVVPSLCSRADDIDQVLSLKLHAAFLSKCTASRLV